MGMEVAGSGLGGGITRLKTVLEERLRWIGIACNILQ